MITCPKCKLPFGEKSYWKHAALCHAQPEENPEERRKIICFTIRIIGKGVTEEEAWADACDAVGLNANEMWEYEESELLGFEEAE